MTNQTRQKIFPKKNRSRDAKDGKEGTGNGKMTELSLDFLQSCRSRKEAKRFITQILPVIVRWSVQDTLYGNDVYLVAANLLCLFRFCLCV
jgi:hypothetical protein